MKRIYIISLFFFIVSSGFSQIRPEAFIDKMPTMPLNLISLNEEQQEAYLTKVNEVQKEIKTEIDRRNKNIKAMAQSMQTQTLQQQYRNNNINPQQLATMSEQERQAWANAYAKQQLQTIQSSPSAAQKKIEQGEKTYNLIYEQKRLTDSLNIIISRISKEFSDIEEDPQRQESLEKISLLKEKLMKQTGIASKDNTELEMQLNAEKEQYTRTYLSRYVTALSHFESFAKSCLPAYYRLEEITNNLSLLQSGVEISNESGGMGLAVVSDYFAYLSNIFKYKLN